MSGSNKSEYIIGGWTQEIHVQPPVTFTCTMYGMVTNLKELATGTPPKQSWNWSPKTTPAPTVIHGDVMWTYGGAGAVPDDMPAGEQLDEIASTCTRGSWAGIDFDNESRMNITNVIAVMEQLKASGCPTSYTFLAGADYVDSGDSTVQSVVESGVCDRFVLMCYGGQMWGMNDIERYVSRAIEKTIHEYGVPEKKVILALTPAGLTAENLDYFLQQVKTHHIGGLFIWNFQLLNAEDLETICTQLGISSLEYM
ncbi:hypothetical protein VA7868_01121 [Vibrio aerogenes CECT 7868]|uniref:Uncharacterized protein n=1 Tax=Vibrio aerogenes CECT 7868 TaxID=1216006 RepID=A0A1M5XG13_9VIBR|nr:hypothetical protein [Vibrio aerogenes]SHH98173.1 hypothetical protein VA7868_01121 [Vibrio aerogenes CECT 7868]